MEPFNVTSSPGASAPTQGPPQPVSIISSTLPNASPNGRTPSGVDNEQQSSENETCSPSKDGGRVARKNRLTVESLTCPSCGKVCSNKSKYMRHLSTHSEDRPYSCPLCKKGFKWVEYLSKHMKQQHPNSSLDIAAVTSSVPQTDISTASEGGVNMDNDENLETAPLLLKGRSIIPTPGLLLPHLTVRQARDVQLDQQQSSSAVEKGVPTLSGNNAISITKDTTANIAEEPSECPGRFKNVQQSAVVIVCSTDTITSTTESLPVTTVAMTTPEESVTFKTSSYQGSDQKTVTFAVPDLSTSTTSSTSVVSLMSQLNNNVMEHSALADGSFDGTYNNPFDQSGGLPSENAVIVPEATINCQLASSLTNNGVQSLDDSRTEDNSERKGSGSTDVVKKYVCEDEGCTKTYRYKKDVIRHMKMKHGSQPTRYEQKEVPEVLLRKHSCEQCEKMYAHRKDLLRHQRDVHSPEAIARREASKGNLKKYPCEQPNCNKFYVHKKDLIRHRRNDHNDFTDTKDMHIPEPVSPSQYSPGPVKRQRTNWATSKVVSMKAETAAEPMAASEVQWLGVTVVKEGNVTAAVMGTSDSNTGTLASNCALFNTSPSSSNAASSLLSLLNSASQQSLPVDTNAAQLIGQTASVHPLFSAVTSNAQETIPPVSTSQ